MPYQRLIYRSHALVSDNRGDELTRILTVSQRNNAVRGVTGALTLCGSTYVQVLEGPKAKVEDLMQVISLDPRHDRIRILGTWRVSRRLFCGWSMANAALPVRASVETQSLLKDNGLGLELVGVLFGLANSSPLTL